MRQEGTAQRDLVCNPCSCTVSAMHTRAHKLYTTLPTWKTHTPNKTLKEQRKLDCLASSWMHVDYAFVHMNFVIVLQFSYFMIQYVYVRMNYPCMYLCIYFYNIFTMVCVQVSGGKNLWMSLEFFIFFLFETVLCYILLL